MAYTLLRILGIPPVPLTENKPERLPRGLKAAKDTQSSRTGRALAPVQQNPKSV